MIIKILFNINIIYTDLIFSIPFKLEYDNLLPLLHLHYTGCGTDYFNDLNETLLIPKVISTYWLNAMTVPLFSSDLFYYNTLENS